RDQHRWLAEAVDEPPLQRRHYPGAERPRGARRAGLRERAGLLAHEQHDREREDPDRHAPDQHAHDQAGQPRMAHERAIATERHGVTLRATPARPASAARMKEGPGPRARNLPRMAVTLAQRTETHSARSAGADRPSNPSLMQKFVIQGGMPLSGTIVPAGNKNGALPILAS